MSTATRDPPAGQETVKSTSSVVPPSTATTTDASPTSYSTANKAYNAGPGWSFAAGLGSVNATNLLIAWRAFAHAPAAAPQ